MLMTKEPYMETYLKEKAKKNKVIDYDVVNRAFKKCKYCNKSFHPAGLPKHEQYCKENPNRKSGYKETRKWQCQYCGSLFTHNKEKKLHETRFIDNPNIKTNSNMDNFDKLRLIQKQFPEIYKILTSEQIKIFLDNEIKNHGDQGE